MIVFPRREDYDGQSGEIRFPVSVIGKTVTCRVATSALAARYGLGDGREALLAGFRANRGELEARIRRKLLQGQYEADGTIFIRATELAQPPGG